VNLLTNGKHVAAVPKEWPEWEDKLGQTYKPGDTVAVATTSGKSPTLKIGVVRRINRLNSSGEEIGRSRRVKDPTTGNWTTTVDPSCSVTIAFEGGRWYSQNNNPDQEHLHTYQYPDNIVKINWEKP
jgi:hypothetical protein